MDGLTGRISFDAQGRRTTFELDLVQLTTGGVEKVILILFSNLVS